MPDTPMSPVTPADDVTRGLATIAVLMPHGDSLDHLVVYRTGLAHGLVRAGSTVMPAEHRAAMLAEVDRRIAADEPATGPLWTLDAYTSVDEWHRIPDDQCDRPGAHWAQVGGDVRETWLGLVAVGVIG